MGLEGGGGLKKQENKDEENREETFEWGKHTANEGPVRIQYKYLVLIYVFPETKLLLSKQNYNVLSPSSYTHISVRDLYISGIGLPILLQGIMWTDAGNIYEVC